MHHHATSRNPGLPGFHSNAVFALPSLPAGRSPLERADHLIAIALLFASVALLLATDGMGFTRDESYYFHAGREYGGWFIELAANIRAGTPLESFRQASIDHHWRYNPEHPVIVKTLFALSRILFADLLGWLDEPTAMRLPGMIFAGALVSLTFLLAREMTGDRITATTAAVSLLLLPRVFFHAHMACFDIPITTMWVAVVYAWWRSFESERWAWATGALWGIALGVKLNAFFLPIVLGLHLVTTRWLAWRRGARNAPFRPPTTVVAMAILGPLLFVALWPRHWFDTIARIRWYVEFHLFHEHYYVDYFGRHFIEPPFPVEYPFVMTVATTPLIWLLAFAIGTIAWLRLRIASPPATPDEPGDHPIPAQRPGDVEPERRIAIDRAPGILLALNILIPFLVIARPETPIFGGIKHWMPALPFMAIAVAHGLRTVAAPLRRPDGSTHPLALSTACLALLGPVALAAWMSHPFGLAWYGEAVGGVTGAADRGAMRNYWGYTSRQALPWLNEHAPPNARVHFHHTTELAVREYRALGWLREDIRSVRNVDHADIVLYHHPKAVGARLNEQFVWQRFNTLSPVHVISLHGVPLLSVYQTPERPTPPAPPPRELP
ncbi:MAG: phospholipid carrier-dependent glycosyltransferase [Deltaproteobacteria bacterium]|nr:MAG: phospholipid carrier-dependent glycosyltransferase [Deltaproteobacteria bacterium]